mmetsp:Transcript_21917/g.53011  ORF Transcript_21917/g.53011 Transcript_21917/m.53011 type:complete len:84 (-) Transcript_21917:2447-2698(-)
MYRIESKMYRSHHDSGNSRFQLRVAASKRYGSSLRWAESGGSSFPCLASLRGCEEFSSYERCINFHTRIKTSNEMTTGPDEQT